MEDLTIRHRNRLRHHYTQTSNVLLFSYQSVSDGAKLTYQVIDSFDWGDAAGLRKGFAHPSLGRLAKIRGVEKRSVRRHLGELERAGLITRQERRGKPSLLVIEDPSAEETDLYLRTLDGRGEDKIVLPTPDKIVRPYKKEERQERQNLVNEEQALPDVVEAGHESNGLAGDRALTVVPRAKREYLASEMLTVLEDEHSLGFYRKVAARSPPQIIFEALSVVKQAARDGAIRKTRGALFAALVKESATPRHE
jgi:DNA-binding transcriptional ArsR family regulator